MGKRKKQAEDDEEAGGPPGGDAADTATGSGSGGIDNDDGGGGSSSDASDDGDETSGTDSGSDDAQGSDDDDSDSDGDDSEGRGEGALPDVSDDEPDGDNDDDGAATAAAEVVVQFHFKSPEEIDFHGLRALLGSYHDGEQFDVSGLVNAIIEQDDVGTVVKADDSDDPIAVFTALNTHAHAKSEWMKQTATWLAAQCKDGPVRKQLSEALSAPSTGLLLNERLINCPPKLAPPLVRMLASEVAEAAEGGGDAAPHFRLKHYLVVSRVFADPERTTMAPPPPSVSAGPSQLSKNKKAKTGGAPDGDGNGGADQVLVYLRPEDQFLHKAARWSFTFPVANRVVPKGDLTPLRLVALVDASMVGGVQRELDRVVGK